MRRIPLRRQPQLGRGFTLIELVVSIVLMGIIIGAVVYFLLPVRQAVDLTTRAELTDIADNSLQRMARDVRLALPNSVRVSGTKDVEFLEVHTAGRYRADGYGAGAPPGGVGATCDGASGDSDQLLFDASDSCFKPIGTVPATISAAHRLVLNNYGAGFAGQNAYEPDTTTSRNWRQIAATATVGTNDRIRFDITTATVPNPFSRTLHDSPGRRFFIVSGPVRYACDTTARTLTRHSGYVITETQPTGSAGNLIADNVSECIFEYAPAVDQQNGLLTVTLTLSKTVSSGATETVRLFHAIHVRNIP